MSPAILLRLLILAALLVLQVGFALGAQAPVDLPGRAESVCVPPGLPPYTTWTPGASTGEPMFLEDPEHRPYVVMPRDYEAAGRTIRTFWLNGAMILVDPDPEDPDKLGWIDDGLANPDSRPRGADARPSCHWIKPVLPPAEEKHGDRI